MKFITRNEPHLSEDQRSIFQQGASFIACSKNLKAGLWHKNTPSYKGLPVGTIGACKIDNTENAAAFLNECADYLHREHGCQIVIGPMNGNTWLKHRLITESNGRLPFTMEPIEPAYYQDVFKQAGFSILSEYSSSLIDLTDHLRDYSSMEKRLNQRGIFIRAVNLSDFKNDLISIYQLSLTGFSNNFLYTPIPEDLFIEKYMSSKEMIDPQLVLLAEKKGKLIGYIFCMPDVSNKSSLIVKTLVCLPEKENAGLGTLLVSKAQQLAKQKGYTNAIHALQHENNTSHRISHRFNATVFRRYALLAKHYPVI